VDGRPIADRKPTDDSLMASGTAYGLSRFGEPDSTWSNEVINFEPAHTRERFSSRIQGIHGLQVTESEPGKDRDEVRWRTWKLRDLSKFQKHFITAKTSRLDDNGNWIPQDGRFVVRSKLATGRRLDPLRMRNLFSERKYQVILWRTFGYSYPPAAQRVITSRR